MKQFLFCILFILSQVLYAQADYNETEWAIVDSIVYSRTEFNALVEELKNKPVDTVRMSEVKYSGRPDKCLCVEYYALRMEGLTLMRDCGNVVRIHYYSNSGLVYITRDNGIMSSHQIYHPKTGQPLNSTRNRILTFEIDPEHYNQGQKLWTHYPDGTIIE